MFPLVISQAVYWALLHFNTLSEIKPLFDAWHLQGLFSLQDMPAKPSTTVARETLYNTICGLHRSDVMTSYDPDVYPGIKIQFVPSKWTAKIFRTGKIILTGITSHEDCCSLVNDLTSVFKKTLYNK